MIITLNGKEHISFKPNYMSTDNLMVLDAPFLKDKIKIKDFTIETVLERMVDYIQNKFAYDKPNPMIFDVVSVMDEVTLDVLSKRIKYVEPPQTIEKMTILYKGHSIDDKKIKVNINGKNKLVLLSDFIMSGAVEKISYEENIQYTKNPFINSVLNGYYDFRLKSDGTPKPDRYDYNTKLSSQLCDIHHRVRDCRFFIKDERLFVIGSYQDTKEYKCMSITQKAFEQRIMEDGWKVYYV